MSASNDSFISFMYMFLTIFGIIVLIALVIAVIHTVAMWKLFDKAGESGVMAIVPIYNVMQQIKIATGKFTLAWVYLAIYIGYIVIESVLNFLPFFIQDAEATAVITILLAIPSLVLSIGTMVIISYSNYMFAKSFGKSDVFCVLSIFFGTITIIIMGFDKSIEYVGPRGVPQNNGFYNNYY